MDFKKSVMLLAIPFSLSLPVSVVAAGDHAAAPMLTDPYFEKVRKQKEAEEKEELGAAEWKKQVMTSFGKSYAAAGEPSIAIFWNRKFNDQLSQWEGIIRHSITGEAAVTSTDKFEPSPQKKEDAYTKNSAGGGKIVSAEYIEKRAMQQRRAGVGEANEFEFGSGFVGSFLEVPAKIVDRDAIMRLVQRDTAQKAGAEMIADSQKVETDALIGYAEYLAEILFTDQGAGPMGKGFMISVKEVATGRIVAMFKSTGTPRPEGGEQAAKFIATSTGYKKVTPEDEDYTPEQVGAQLAYETMEALAKIW